jgi:hypothetical protein
VKRRGSVREHASRGLRARLDAMRARAGPRHEAAAIEKRGVDALTMA